MTPYVPFENVGFLYPLLIFPSIAFVIFSHIVFKVIYLDADVIPRKNLDFLFDGCDQGMQLLLFIFFSVFFFSD